MSPSSVNVITFGAKGDGKTDSSSAFQKAINSLTNGGEVRVPVGIFIIKNVVIKSKISLVGEGAGTILKLPVTSKVWDMVLITGGNVLAEDVIISDMTIDGSADMIKLKDVQMHGIDVEGGSKNLTITRVNFQNICGDGIRTTEDGDLKIVPQFVNITSCSFKTIGRQDIAVVHAYDVLITDCMGTGALDIEPEKPLVKRVTVINCTFNELDAASKNDAELADIVVKDSHFQESLLWSLRGMLVYNCEINHMRISTARDVTIQNNTMKMLELFPASGSVCSAITVVGNTIDTTTSGSDKPIAGISGQAGTGLYMWNAQNCTITKNTIAGEVCSIYVSSGCNQTTISNNIIKYVKGKLSPKSAVLAINKSDGLIVTENSLNGWSKGIEADGSSNQSNMIIENNQFTLTTEQCIDVKSSINTSIKNNTFNNNGAIYIYKGTASITDNTFNNSTMYRVILEKCTATVGRNKATNSNNLYKNVGSQITYL